MSTWQFASVVDLLDGFFGGPWSARSIESLTAHELDLLAESVDEYYVDYAIPTRPSNVYRCYSGGATFSQSALVPSGPSGGVRPISVTSIPIFARSAPLYADEIVINCPLDSWVYSYRDFRTPGPYWSYRRKMAITPLLTFEPYGHGYRGSDEAENRIQMARALAMLDHWAEPIRQGWLIPVPHLRHWKRREHAIWTQVRYDSLDPRFHELLEGDFQEMFAVGDNARGLGTVPSEGWLPQDAPRAQTESTSLYNNAMLAIAADTNARFLPTADCDYAFLHHRAIAATSLSRALRDALTVDALNHVWLPGFEEADVATICSIRNNEEGFAQWRNGLRSLLSGSFLPSDMSRTESRRLVHEAVTEHVDAIRSDIAKSRSLGGRLRNAQPQTIDFAYALAVFALPGEALVKALAGVSVPILKAALSAFSPQVTGGNSVVLAFDKAGWQQRSDL